MTLAAVVRSGYDSGMTAAKIAITLPRAQLAEVQLAVRDGRADSVSGYISRAVARQAREDSLAALLDDLTKEHGKPSRKAEAWARRVLGKRRG